MTSRVNRLLHYVSLGQPGGVERHFAEFVGHAYRLSSDWEHSVVAAGARVHPFVKRELRHVAVTDHEKYFHGVKLPSKPQFLRRKRLANIVARRAPSMALIWNRPVRNQPFLAALQGRPWLYWEHGAAWFTGDEALRQDFYRHVPGVIANSFAAKRMLQLRWECPAEIEVCLNALRPGLRNTSDKLAGKIYPRNRKFRLGFAGRLLDIKGVPLVLHAVHVLKNQGLDIELHIAGNGPLEASLKTLAGKLSIGGEVTWHGATRDMSGFYRHIDCLLHPAVREPFGLVCVEAGAFGCPVIAAKVDGLPEAVHDSVTGVCLQPELPSSDYDDLGGRCRELPPFVYHPERDAIGAPLLVNPSTLAAVVRRVIEDPDEFRRLSDNAVMEVDKMFDFGRHVGKVLEVLDRRLDSRGK